MAEAVAEGERVGELKGVGRSRLSGNTGFRVDGGKDVFTKFVASELGRCEERSKDIDEISPVVIVTMRGDEIWN